MKDNNVEIDVKRASFVLENSLVSLLPCDPEKGSNQMPPNELFSFGEWMTNEDECMGSNGIIGKCTIQREAGYPLPKSLSKGAMQKKMIHRVWSC